MGTTKKISPGERWERGIPHDPRSIEIVEYMQEIDWDECGGALDIKTGGDGDIGETMMYYLDCFFAEKDEKK
jgi:hypothetical protein